MVSDKDEVWMTSKDLDTLKDDTSNLILTLGNQEVKSSFEVKEYENEDVMSQFSNEEGGSAWVDSSVESMMDLIHLNSNHFIKISDGEESEWISIINITRFF